MKIASLVLLLIIAFKAYNQHINTGLVFDNYFNSNSVTYNPSSIVDSKSKISFSTSFNSNLMSNFYKRDYAIYAVNGFSEGKLVDGKKKGYQNNDFNTDVFNIKYELDHKNAIAYTFRTRFYNNRRGIPQVWNENAGLVYGQNTINTQVDISGFSLSQMGFTEHVFSYARTIFDKNESLLKAGASIKILNGLSAKYMYFNSGTITFLDGTSDFAEIKDLDVSIGENFENAQMKYKNRGFGLDIGATYELRPYYEKQYYDMDGEKNIIRYDMNKYTVKFTASITDIGAVKYMRDSSSVNFTDYNGFVNAGNLYDVGSDIVGVSPYNYVNSNIKPFATESAEQEKSFRMTLPTMLHAGVDYRIQNFKFFKNDLYVSYNFAMPLIGGWDKTRVAYGFMHTVTPRIEKQKYSVMMPISQTGNGRVYFGMAGRLNMYNFSFFAGSNNLAFLFGQKASLTRNVFMGLSYNILHDVPSDIDKDKVSDFKDDCPYDPGFLEYKGCPDTDSDGIPDKEDYCIYDQGTKATKGCPDTDGDGIIDMNDMCPEVKGLGVHYGCPDRDYDGVIDAADKCPDIPGIELNNGCPFENPGCCMDNDGDGVSNNADKCPDHAGSVYNDGCPIDQNNINKINLQEEKKELDPNNTGSQIKVLNNNDTIRNFISTKAELSKLIASKTVMKEHSIYFDTDQAMVTETEQKSLNKFMEAYKNDKTISVMVIGNTDRDGSLDYNLILSKKRAEIVKRKLIDAGFNEEKIQVYYYGEEKSLHKGSYTAEQKRMDRRVDIKIIKGN